MTNLDGSALVLGGGGITGIGWEIGLLTGLSERGLDLTSADLIIGTSAGSVVGAQLRMGTSLADLYARQLNVVPGETGLRLGRLTLLKYAWAIWRSKTAAALGMRMGHLALSAKTETEAQRRPAFKALLGDAPAWPQRDLQVTAVNAATGGFRVFDKNSNVALLHAVGASCAVPGVWPPVTIDGARYIDGGMRSATNSQLAEGRKRVVIIAPLAFGAGPMTPLRTQVEALKAGGSLVAVVTPDSAARKAMGPDALDPAHRADAAREGRRQAGSIFRAVSQVWAS